MSRKGHIPVRTCIGCRKRREKGELLRFILTADGKAQQAEKKGQSGRGVYLCPDERCLKTARKKHRFIPLDLHL